MNQHDGLTRAVVLVIEIDVSGVFLTNSNEWHWGSPFLWTDLLRSLPVQRKLPPSQIPYLTDFRNWGSTSSLLVEHFDRGGNHPDYRRDRHPQSAAVEDGSRRGRSLGAVRPESESRD